MGAALEIVRKTASPDAPTLGELFIEGVHFCFTLEDPDLNNRVDVSCIPTGVYQVMAMYSVRFERDMPRVLGVPGRTGILLHMGNTDADTEGCILLGERQSQSAVYDSVKAFDRFMTWFDSCGGTATLTILNPQPQYVPRQFQTP
jgi:hypothetical protein